MLRIADREEGRWEVMKCYLSDDFAFDSDNGKQLSRACRVTAANKKKRETNKQKDKKKQFWNGPLPVKNPKSLENHTKDTVALGTIQILTKSVLPADKKGIFNISAQIEETETTINSNRNWEILYKTEDISVRWRLKENSHFWKNELKSSLFVQNIMDNGYVCLLLQCPCRFLPQTANPV